MRSKWLGAVALVLAVAAGFVAVSCKKSTSPGGGGGAADVTIGITGVNGTNSYFPDSVGVTVGQTVAWHNTDSITHTATSNTIGIFDTGNIGSGGTSGAIQMNATGTFAYHCAIHGVAMTGKITVSP
jgi:plastocyanin